MHDFNDTPKKAVLLIAAIAIVALTVGFAVVRLSDDRAGPAASPPGEEGAGDTDVAALLPHSEEELQDAVAVADDFAAAYFGGSGDSADDLAGLATPEYADLLAAEGAVPPAEGAPSPQGGGAGSAAETTGIRDLAEGSVTCIVRVGTASGDGGEQPREYAVGLTLTGDGWRVNGVQDAALGDPGAA
ncbi:hypothetical protein ACFOVU_19475 [Nocardiopsis sediminis]|uniref:Mce-associated membrane protein n=1 Tax=Nocardiopsis sediminis TaxID=1778267 RepID=A0ABV8FRX1_9ACTN